MLSESKIPESLKAQLLKEGNQESVEATQSTDTNQKGDTSDNQEIGETLEDIMDEMDDIEDKSVDTMEEYGSLTKKEKEQYGL